MKVSAIDRLREYLDYHPEIRNHLAEWVEDFILDRTETCWLRWFAETPLVTYLNKRAEMFILAASANENRQPLE